MERKQTKLGEVTTQTMNRGARVKRNMLVEKIQHMKREIESKENVELKFRSGPTASITIIITTTTTTTIIT